MSMRFFLLGERAVSMRSIEAANLDCQRRVWNMASRLQQEAGLIDVVPGMNNLTAIFDPERVSGDAILDAMQRHWSAATADLDAGRKLQIPVRYGGTDGPDLEFVARHTGLTPEAVVAAHSAAQYAVYFLGFQPGFAYMGGLPEILSTPRLVEPRLSVPAGSVGIGGTQTGIYPSIGPGGWQLIGRTSVCLFDPAADQPIFLRAGDLIQFVAESP